MTDANQLFGSLYMGPDYRVSGEERAAMLDRAIGHQVWICTGLDHLDAGPWPWVLSGAMIGVALLVLAWPRRPSVMWPGLALLIVAISSGALTFDAFFLRHMLEDVGPDRWPADLFAVGAWVTGLGALVAAGASLVERSRLKATNTSWS